MTQSKAKKARPKPIDLTTQLEASIKAATWLTEADLAAVQLARDLAKQLLELGFEAQIRDRVALAKALADVLKDLGLSVAGRTGKPDSVREVTPLDALRNRQAVRIANASTTYTVSK